MSSLDTSVAVVGGGVVGCAVLHALTRSGVPAVLLEAAVGAEECPSGTQV